MQPPCSTHKNPSRTPSPLLPFFQVSTCLFYSKISSKSSFREPSFYSWPSLEPSRNHLKQDSAQDACSELKSAPSTPVRKRFYQRIDALEFSFSSLNGMIGKCFKALQGLTSLRPSTASSTATPLAAYDRAATLHHLKISAREKTTGTSLMVRRGLFLLQTMSLLLLNAYKPFLLQILAITPSSLTLDFFSPLLPSA